MHRPIDARKRRDVLSEPRISFRASRRNVHGPGLPVTGKVVAHDQNLAIILILHTSIIAWVMMVGIGYRATSSGGQTADARRRSIGVRVFEAERQTAGVEIRRCAWFKRTGRCLVRGEAFDGPLLAGA